jgi:hypothetical protein
MREWLLERDAEVARSLDLVEADGPRRLPTVL